MLGTEKAMRILKTGNLESGELSLLELTIIIKILKNEQALEKSEFEKLAESLQFVAEGGKREAVKELIQSEIRQYEEKGGQRTFLKLFGDLLMCISQRNAIQLDMKEVGQMENKIFPVAIEYHKAKFYLLGYQANEEQRLVVFSLDANDKICL